MQRTGISLGFQANNTRIANRIDLFFDKFNLGRLATSCGITKSKGISPRMLLMTLLALPFLGQNIFRGVVRNNSCEFGKDAVYDFLGSSRFSWRRLLLMVAMKASAIRHIRPKYACRACEGVEDDGPTVKTVPMPPQLIPQGIVSPGLLAHVAVAKMSGAAAN